MLFWLGLFLIQSYTMMASPSLKECRILMLENEVERKVSVYAVGGRSLAGTPGHGTPGAPASSLGRTFGN